MDPNANLEEQREIRAQILEGRGNFYANPQHAIRLAELSEAMDTWLTNGGFLPTAWKERLRRS